MAEAMAEATAEATAETTAETTAKTTAGTALLCWRHPRAIGATGRCIGQTDLPVDPRKAKRLAHRIRKQARRERLTFEVWVSDLRRSRDVGRCLRRWGWRVRVDARLAEMNFGAWDGQPWSDIAWADVQAWQDDFLHHAPGGGESLWQVAQRAWALRRDAQHSSAGQARIVVTHGGWINALVQVSEDTRHVSAALWPMPPRHSSLTRCW
jgi:alpha-ribazole phosphatase